MGALCCAFEREARGMRQGPQPSQELAGVRRVLAQGLIIPLILFRDAAELH